MEILHLVMGVFVTRTYLSDVSISKNDPLFKNGVWADWNQRNLDQNHQHSVYKLCLIQCSITVDKHCRINIY